MTRHQPAGTPVGGQFATSARSEASVRLPAGPSAAVLEMRDLAQPLLARAARARGLKGSDPYLAAVERRNRFWGAGEQALGDRADDEAGAVLNAEQAARDAARMAPRRRRLWPFGR